MTRTKRAPKPKLKPVETFPCHVDPLTGWPIDPLPTYRKCIPVYDRDSGELREFIL
jgi:hypothetical protein